MNPSHLSRSYAFCRNVARSKARNFYYAFVLLPPKKRNALCAVYAFMRHSDDLVDDPSLDSNNAKKERLSTWREELQFALKNGNTNNPALPALVDAIQRFSIPQRYFFELLDGMEMDLEKNRYQTFEELYRYCYHVASVVGLVCIHIFGFSHPEALEYAEWAGIAFQLTNILRDLASDYKENRVYLPQEDLERFCYPEKNLGERVINEHFRKLIQFEVERARDYYDKSEPLVGLVHPESRKALQALIAIYRALLEKISRHQEEILQKRISLSFLEKIRLVYNIWRKPACLLEVA
jgi:phytoene synthase